MSRHRNWLTPAVLAGASFVALGATAAVLNTGWVAGWDAAVEAWFDQYRGDRKPTGADRIFGYIGSPVHVLTAALVGGTLLSARARSALPVFLVTGAVGAGVAVEQTLKATVGRTAAVVAQLQDSALPQYQHSFPSGHVTGAAALLGTIALCLGAGRGRATRVLPALAAVAGVVAVAVLALYTRAHTFSDVIGGMLLGGALVSLGAAVLGSAAAGATGRD